MFIGTNPKKLLDELIAQGKIESSLASQYQELSNDELEKKLRTENIVSSGDILSAYSKIYSLPIVHLNNQAVKKEVLELISENLAREFHIIAYSFDEKTLKIAVSEPAKLASDLQDKLEEIKKKKGIKIELAITSQEDFEKLIKVYQTAPGLPKVELGKIVIPYDVITKFPQEIAQKYQMVVFESPHSSFIKVAVVNPDDQRVREILDFVKEKNDIAIEEYQTFPNDIAAAMKYYQKAEPAKAPEIKEETKEPVKESDEEIPVQPASEIKIKPASPKYTPEPPKENVPEVMSKKEAQPTVSDAGKDLDNFLGQQVNSVEDLKAVAETGHVPKTVAAMVALAVQKKASDIHIEPEEKNLRLRMRMDGILRDILILPLDIQPAVISRVKILANMKIDETRVPQDGRFDVKTGGHAIDLRISTLPTVHGEKVAMRILDKSARLYTMEELGIAGRGLKLLISNIDKPYGIILSTGPTGSGKSTTLYAILNRISTSSVNIVTLEDPVEYELAGLNQCQIKPRIGFTFANGLRSVLRQDPNVIMVGEIRDSETASLAIHAALTGHLVLSTLHTNDAAGALPRLINMGVEPFLITSSMNAIIAQRLVRKLCQKCKIAAHIPTPILKEIEYELEGFHFPKPYQFFEGGGCPECDQGYKGRVGIFEVMAMTEEVESLALSKKPSSEIKAAAVRAGMVTMKQDGLIKALKGITSVNEVLRVVTI